MFQGQITLLNHIITHQLQLGIELYLVKLLYSQEHSRIIKKYYFSYQIVFSCLSFIFSLFYVIIL
jgi:hypothetical protein